MISYVNIVSYVKYSWRYSTSVDFFLFLACFLTSRTLAVSNIFTNPFRVRDILIVQQKKG